MFQSTITFTTMPEHADLVLLAFAVALAQLAALPWKTLRMSTCFIRRDVR